MKFPTLVKETAVLAPVGEEQKKVYSLIAKHYRSNQKKLVYKVGRIAGVWNEDAVQEGYANALQYWRTYDQNKPFHNWINKIITNAAIKMSRWEKGHGQGENKVSDLFTRKTASPYTIVKARRAYLLIQEEKEPKRECLQFALIDECTYEEVELLTRVKSATVRGWVKRFRDEHKEMYG